MNRVVHGMNWKFSIIGLFLLLICFAPFAKSSVASSQPDTFVINPPTLAPSYFSPLPHYYTPLVYVEVNTTLKIFNATLYYLVLPMTCNCNPTTNLSAYTSILMNLTTISDNVYNFTAKMPSEANNTFVMGQASVTLQNGTILFSELRQMYYVQDAPPSEFLTIDFYVTDIDPQFLNISVLSQGQLYNSISGSGVTLFSGSTYYAPPITISKQVGSYYWTFSNVNLSLFYNAGDPHLYPFDKYAYTIDYSLPYFFNQSYLAINNYKVYPNVSCACSIGYTVEGTKQYLDLSQWNIGSVLSYIPGNSSRLSQLQVTITITRNQESVDVLMIPLIAMYGLLGSSLLLKGDEKIQNRLFIYISIFVFAFGFFTGMKTFSIIPTTPGLTMAERLAFALVPCTVIMGVFSLISLWFNNKRSHLIDTLSIMGAILAIYAITRFSTVVSYNPFKSAELSAFSLGPWSLYLLASLIFGLVWVLVLPVVQRRLHRFENIEY